MKSIRHSLDALGVQAGRGVQDGDAVGHQLAVRDHRQLHGLDVVQGDLAVLVGGHQVGHAQHGHVVDGLQAAETGAVGRVADVVAGVDDVRAARGQCDLADLRHRQHLALGVLDGDQLRLGPDHGDDVVGAAPGGDVVEGLDGLAALLHHQFERVVGGLAGRLHLDADAGQLRLLGGDGQRDPTVHCGRQFGDGRGVAGGAPDPDHVRGAAAVEEVAVDGVREVVALDEVAEGALELGPAGDQDRLVDRPLLGESDEGGDRGPDGLDRPRAR
ncbi:hypothetical protein GCM10018954_048790 [Kutzneria kofuensis]